MSFLIQDLRMGVEETCRHRYLSRHCPTLSWDAQNLVAGTQMETIHENKTSRSPCNLKLALFNCPKLQQGEPPREECHTVPHCPARTTTCHTWSAPKIASWQACLTRGRRMQPTFAQVPACPLTAWRVMEVCLNSLPFHLLSCTVESLPSAVSPSPAG